MSTDRRDALARALCKADGKVWWTDAIPAVYHAKADALMPLLTDWAGAAWDQGYEAGGDDEAFWARGLSTDPDAAEHPHDNPYRTEGIQ